MRLIVQKNNQIIMTHSGVRGMKWGIRKAEDLVRGERNLKTKASNIVKQHKGKQSTNMSDIANAEWLAGTTGSKVGKTVAMSVGSAVLSLALSGKNFSSVLSNPAYLKKIAEGVAINSVRNFTMNEVSARVSMRRYKQDGTKDKSKKQYKYITPEEVTKRAIKFGINIAPIARVMLNKPLREAESRGRMRRQQAESMVGRMLPKKTSDMHTIYESVDGLTAILERIKP